MKKKCFACKIKKETTDFHKCIGNKDGYNSWCKKCAKLWRLSPAGVESGRKASKKYHLSSKGILAHEHYKKIGQIKATMQKYNKTEKGKRSLQKAGLNYRKTEQGKRIVRNLWLKAQYGLSLEEYEKMYEKQNGRCKICYEYKLVLSVDHNHMTEKVRNLLCRYCNQGIGSLEDNIQLLESAVAYLKSFEEGNNAANEQNRI